MVQNSKKIRIGIGSFDLLKGLAILVVILGHIPPHYNSQKLFELNIVSSLWLVLKPIGIATIPMFLIISGYGFKEKSGKKILKKTCSEMLVPYFWVMMAYVIIHPVTAYLRYHDFDRSISLTIGYVLAFLLGLPEPGKVMFGYNLRWCSAVWYLLTLFVSLNLMNAILKLRKPVWQAITVAVCVVVGYILIIQEITYFCIPQGLMSVGYCYAGYLFKKHKLIERFLYNPWIYIALTPIALMETLWGKMDLCYGEFNNVLLDYIGAGCSALLLIFIVLHLNRLEWRAMEHLKNIGIYSYWILCIHAAETECLQWGVYAQKFPEHQGLAFIIEAVVLKPVIIIGVCTVLKKITRYNYKKKMIRNGK